MKYDPGEQLAFMEDELRKLDAVGGKAIIMSHIYTLSCDPSFGIRYHALIDRY